MKPEARPHGNLYASSVPGRPVTGLVVDSVDSVLTAAYGLVNAPAGRRRSVQRVLLDLGYRESVFDPCLYLLQVRTVDAQVWCCLTSTILFKAAMTDTRNTWKFGM